MPLLQYADLNASEDDKSDPPTSVLCRHSASSSGKCTAGWCDSAPQPLQRRASVQIEWEIALYRAVCVILFIVNRMHLPFGFLLVT